MSKEINLFNYELDCELDCELNKEEKVDSQGSESLKEISEKMEGHIKSVIEALLFSSCEPLTLEKIREIIQNFYFLPSKKLQVLIEELKEQFISQNRSYQLEEIAEGYILRTHQKYAPYLQSLHQRRQDKLSQAAAEVLALIASRQPVTRPQIDAIRGVDSSAIVAQLLERELIEQQGKLEVPGRPGLYVTTSRFLKSFGLKNLQALKREPL